MKQRKSPVLGACKSTIIFLLVIGMIVCIKVRDRISKSFDNLAISSHRSEKKIINGESNDCEDASKPLLLSVDVGKSKENDKFSYCNDTIVLGVFQKHLFCNTTLRSSLERCTGSLKPPHIVTVRNTGDYWYYPDHLGKVRAQFPFASVEKKLGSLTVRVQKRQSMNKTLAAARELIPCQKGERMNVSDQSQRPVIREKTLENLVQIRNTLQSIEVTAFLCFGTLLGWYRDCGFISKTTDIDICIFSEEYDQRLASLLDKSENLSWYWTHGKSESPFLITVVDNQSVKIDIFLVYRDLNDSHYISGLNVGKRQEIRWQHPPMNHLCRGDLLGELFHVPCNVVQVLEANYGQNWSVPVEESTYNWLTSPKSWRLFERIPMKNGLLFSELGMAHDPPSPQAAPIILLAQR